MKTARIGKNILQLTFMGFSNCYLLREKNGMTLIDTSTEGHAEEIMNAARDFGTQICRIVLTHAHADHMGSLDELHHLMGKVDVGCSEREALLLRGDLSLFPDEPQQKPKGTFPGAKTKPTHLLADGELYGSLRCISTPGHTPGHMSFLHEPTGTLFTGDALQSIGRLTVVTDTPWYFPLPKMATWDDDLALRSAQRLDALRPMHMATGHGPVVDRASALHRAVEHATPQTA